MHRVRRHEQRRDAPISSVRPISLRVKDVPWVRETKPTWMRYGAPNAVSDKEIRRSPLLPLRDILGLEWSRKKQLPITHASEEDAIVPRDGMSLRNG
jgi:hypothetical protein